MTTISDIEMIPSKVPLETMTTISDLPLILIETILSKVPITSLGAVRCTCKRWDSLSKKKVICKAGARSEFVGFMVNGMKPEPVDVLLCFDFTRESFGPFLPLPFPHYVFDTGSLSSLRDEKLEALYQDECRRPAVEIWVTTNVSPDAVSWTPFLKVALAPFTSYQFQFDIDAASFFIDEEMKAAVVFNLDELSRNACCQTAYIIPVDGPLRKVALAKVVNHQGSADFRGVEYCYPLVCSSSYAPSLVQIK